MPNTAWPGNRVPASILAMQHNPDFDTVTDLVQCRDVKSIAGRKLLTLRQRDGVVGQPVESAIAAHVADAGIEARQDRLCPLVAFPLHRGFSRARPNLVESRCGAVAVGRTDLLPPLSSGGALLVRPWLRLHTHRVTGGGRPPPVPTERGMRISRTNALR
jgi:hypothetical protein